MNRDQIRSARFAEMCDPGYDEREAASVLHEIMSAANDSGRPYAVRRLQSTVLHTKACSMITRPDGLTVEDVLAHEHEGVSVFMTTSTAAAWLAEKRTRRLCRNCRPDMPVVERDELCPVIDLDAYRNRIPDSC